MKTIKKLAILTLCCSYFWLSGCSSGEDSSEVSTAETSQTEDNVILISGTLPSKAIEGFPFKFQFSIQDDSSILSAENLPSWLSFDSTTGTLSGIPDAAGRFSNIKVLAKKDSTTTTVGPFEINVSGDPLAQFAWHLNNRGQNTFASNSATIGKDINAFNLIQTGLTGKGVKIAISDTGLEIGHEDLAGNILADQSRNYNLSAPFIGDPTPSGSGAEDAHGTAVTGIAAAISRNEKGSRGIAPEASIAGFLFLGTDLDDAKFIDQAEGQFDIFNYSYGTPQCVFIPISSSYYDQLQHGVTNLRNGKGAIYVKSAGNDRIQNLSNCNPSIPSGFFYTGNSNMDGKNTTPFTIIAGAVNANGRISSYSSPGSNIWVSAPGGEFGDDDPAILTTDLSSCSKGFSKSSTNTNSFENGEDSLNPNCNYTSIMNGTSSAAPALTGTIALMLEANPNLTWRDVKLILASTAITVETFDNSHPLGADLSGHDYGNASLTNDAGFSFSNQFGFGMVNAKAAVEEAQAYEQTLPLFVDTISKNSGTSFYTTGTLDQSIPDNSPTGTFSSIFVRHRLVVEAIRIKFSVEHTFSGDLGIELTSPNGTKSTILNINSNLLEANLTDAALLSNAFFGESSFGQWGLRVVDGAAVDVGKLKGWSIEVFGHAKPNPDAEIPNPVNNLTITQQNLAEGTQLTGTWNHGTGDFNRYEFSIGNSAGFSDIFSWEAIGTSTTAVASGLTIPDGDEVFFNVRTVGSQEVNVSMVSAAVTIDRTPPPLPTLSNFTNGQIVRDPNLVLTGTCEPDAELQLLFANDALNLISSDCDENGVLSIIFEALITGTRSFTVLLRDAAGNTSQQTFSFLFTDAPPVLVTSIEPNSGTGEGGDRIVIKGIGFGPSVPEVSIFLGGGFADCLDIVLIDSTHIECSTPVIFSSGFAVDGPQDIKINNVSTAEEIILEDGFTFVPPWSSTSSENILEGRIRGVHAQIGSEVLIWGGMTPPNGDAQGDGAIYDFETNSWRSVSNTNAPSARRDASIVSTGSKYIVWGGFGQSEDAHLSDGYIYDPITDSWTAISNTGAPAERSFHGAVWTGSKMLVWGGLGESGILGDGASYDPSTDTWTPITSAPAGQEKKSAAVVWTGSKMLVWGGSNGAAVNTGALYDPSTNTWSETTTIGAPSPREKFGSTWTGSELFVWGGIDGDSEFNDGALYNPSTDSWETVAAIGLPERSGATAQFCDGKVIFWGGTNSLTSTDRNGGSFNTLTRSKRTLTFAGNHPERRSGHLSACHENKILIWGGTIETDEPSKESPVGGIYLVPTADSASFF